MRIFVINSSFLSDYPPPILNVECDVRVHTVWEYVIKPDALKGEG